MSEERTEKRACEPLCISIGYYGGRTRRRMSIEIDGRDKRELKYKTVEEALIVIEQWLRKEGRRDYP